MSAEVKYKPLKPIKTEMKVSASKGKECFIVMPITTPESSLPAYKSDADHFRHVLECLFIPAIEKAELKPIKPIAKGAELIQGRTIKYIEQSELVLCDISSLNANVFFELGIRTAINKPLCLVKDDITEKIPFDTSNINHHTYKSSLNTWEMQEEIEKLSAHILETHPSSKQGNELWKYFSLSASAAPLREDFGKADQFSFLSRQIDSLREELRAKNVSLDSPFRVFDRAQLQLRDENIIRHQSIIEALARLELSVKEIAMSNNVEVTIIKRLGDRKISVHVRKGALPNEAKALLDNFAREFGFKIDYVLTT